MVRQNKDEVLEFINRRFQNDCMWTTGNCYYFAIILKDRFPKGEIYYDVIYGHFIFKYKGKFYDWNGIVTNYETIIKWDEFKDYDELEQQRIIRDCIR